MEKASSNMCFISIVSLLFFVVCFSFVMLLISDMLFLQKGRD